jgi:hypothetical protein
MIDREIVEAFAELLREYGKLQCELLERTLKEYHASQDALVDRLLARLEALLASPREPLPPSPPPRPRVN